MLDSITEVQKLFFSHLFSRFGPDTVLYESMKCLNLKKGAIYKRINGETALTAAEMVSLTYHFKISLDTIFNHNKYITFEHPFSHQPSSYKFFELFSFFLKPLKSHEKSSMIYLANELPVFYYFSFPNLFNFVISIWGHLHWNNQKLEIKANDEIDQHINVIRTEIAAYYNHFHVSEIWNQNMFSNLYQQIVFAISIKAFKEKDVIRLVINDIRNLIDHLYLLTVEGKILGNMDRKIYLNDFGSYLNIVLYKSEKINTTFIGYDIPQFLVSYDKSFHDFSNEWIKKLLRRSSLISGESYQTRELFFQKIESEYDIFSKKVNQLTEIYYE